ncbi:MAG: alginate O-acetyltransferase AlgX-related protein [Myxococcota bacterium]
MKRVLAPLLLVAGSLLFCALVGEVALRIAWGGYYEKFDPERPFGEYDFHPTRGLMPGKGVEQFDWNREFQIWKRHNSLGFRGPEFPLEKPPGTTRVLVLGDSMTYGTGVEYEETFSARLDAMDPTLHVINGGTPGYHGGHQLLLLEEWIEPLQPDLVLVAYFWNDLWGAFGVGGERRSGGFAHYDLRDGELVFVPADPPTPENPSFDHLRRRHERRARRYGGFLASESYLYRFLSDRMKILGYAIRDWRGEATEVETGGELDAAQEEAAWQLSYALLRRQRQVAREHGAKFAILVVPDQVQVEPDVKVLAVPPVLWHIQERIRAFAEAEGVPLVEPLETMRAIREREGEPQYHRIDRHWNRLGHRHMAEVLDRELRRQGLLPPRPASGGSG